MTKSINNHVITHMKERVKYLKSQKSKISAVNFADFTFTGFDIISYVLIPLSLLDNIICFETYATIKRDTTMEKYDFLR